MIFMRDNRQFAWQVAQQDPTKFNRSMAVGRIINNRTGEGGTAFRIGPENRLMTNAHVLNSGNPRDYRIEFQGKHGNVTTVNGDRLLSFSPRGNGLDYALFTVAPHQFDKIREFGHLDIDPRGAQPNQGIYIPQYGEINGQYHHKTFAIADDTQTGSGSGRVREVYRHSSAEQLKQRVQYTMDVKPGSSGSPVISSDTHKVVALNNGNNGTPGPWARNVASNMMDIWRQIKGFFDSENSNMDGRDVLNANTPKIGKRRYGQDGSLEEYWKNPSGGVRWMPVWQNKAYRHGSLVVHKGRGYAYYSPNNGEKSSWIPIFDPKLRYGSNNVVSYYGSFLSTAEARDRFNRGVRLR